MNFNFTTNEPAKDYSRAREYLGLKYPPEVADKIVAKLQKAPVQRFKPSDLFRATDTEPLPMSDAEVQHVARKLQDGKKTDPVLVVVCNGHASIADGSHHASLYAHLAPHKRIPVQVAHFKPKAL